MALKDGLKQQVRRGLLGGLHLAARPRSQVRGANAPLRVLLIRPDHLGDVLLCTPALHRLRQALPDAEITALILPSSALVLSTTTDVDHVLHCDFPGFSRSPKKNAVAPYAYALQQARRLRDLNFDLVINLRYDFWWGGLLAYLADIPQRVGYDWPESRQFLTDLVPLPERTVAPDHPQEDNPDWHAAALNLNLIDYVLHSLGVAAPDVSPALRFAPAPADVRRIDLQLGEWGVERTGRLVAVHPGSGATLKLWTVEGFAAVGDGLAEQHGAQIVIVAGPGEAVLARRIAQRMQTQPLLWLAGTGSPASDTRLSAESSFGQMAALFARCSLVVGLDSGPMHLAVAVGVPTLHLYGPTDPTLFGPWGDPQRQRVVRTTIDLPCCPCGVLDFRRGCWRGGFCMRSITPTQVLDAAHEMLMAVDRGL